MSLFYEVEDIPIESSVLIPTREEAIAFPRADLRLDFCPSCGFIQNTVFNAVGEPRSLRYEDTQAFSSRFSQFARTLALRLMERYDLRGKTILEIGCGRGDFLVLLCEMGGNCGIGIDPRRFREWTDLSARHGIRFIQDVYSEDHFGLSPDLICCRHTLEHIQPTRVFVQLVRDAIRHHPSTIVFFELPDVSRVLKEGAFWDVYYEHCSYFSREPLDHVFRRSGFAVLSLTKEFGDQYLLIEARGDDGSTVGPLESEHDLGELTRDVRRFSRDCSEQITAWRKELKWMKGRGRRAALWGSGSKAVAFLTTLKTADAVEYVVDINPRKQGMHLPGTGHTIVSPDLLQASRPDVIIVMNPIYTHEIHDDLEKLKVSAELIPVGSYSSAPSRENRRRVTIGTLERGGRTPGEVAELAREDGSGGTNRRIAHERRE
jgi:SAM-dependent methyltransferase